LNDVGWYEKNGIRLHLGKKVVKIERGARKVVAADGTAESYDRLLLATGSNPFILPVPGRDLEGVITYRDIQDTNAMIEASKKYRQAVVIGGGLLGLEAANDLKLRRMNVTVGHGIEYEIDTQLYRTAAQVLQPPLVEMAKVCANHLAHFGIGRYAGSVTSTKLKVTGIDLFSAGEFSGGAGTEDIVLNDALGGVYKRIVLRENRIVGAVLYGDTADGSWYYQLLRDKQNVAEIRDHLMFGQNHLGNTGQQGQSP